MTTKFWKFAIPALLVLLTAACSGTSSDTSTAAGSPTQAPTAGSTPAPASPSQAPPPAGDVLAAAAAKIGCEGYTQSDSAAPNADRWGTCTRDGAKVQLYEISSDTAYQAFLTSVSAYGVTEAQMVRVGDVVAAPADQTQIDAIRTALAG